MSHLRINHFYFQCFHESFFLDGMVTNRDDSSSGNGVQERVLSVLLNEMDGIGGSNPNQCEVS